MDAKLNGLAASMPSWLASLLLSFVASMNARRKGAISMDWSIDTLLAVVFFGACIVVIATQFNEAIADPNITGIVATVLGFGGLLVTAMFFKKLKNS
jgi:hypothetical protein